ncbi:MAG: DUF885 domain-containing protein [Chloroflexota bacterium]
MTTALYLFLVALGVVFVWWLVSLIWGKPWSINHFYARVFLDVLFDNPEIMTSLGILERMGIHWHNAKLTDASDAHEVKLLKKARRDLEMLRSYDRQRQNQSQLLSTDILDWFIDDQVRGEPYRHHDYPLNQMFGVQSELPNFMMTIHPLNSRLEARNYIRRLSKFSVKLDQVLEGLKIRESKGCLPPHLVVQHVLNEMKAFISSPVRENPLYTVFKDKTAKLKLNPRVQDKLLKAVEVEIECMVYPAYQKLIDYFVELEPRVTTNHGVWNLPNGEAYYTYCLRSSTSTDLSPEQVHEIGLKEVERIEAEMTAILEGLGYVGVNPVKQLHALTQEECFMYPNDEKGRAECLADYQRILEHIDQTLDEVFEVRPKAGLQVERVPEFREKTMAGAYYQPPDLGGSRPGVFYVNLRDMEEIPKFGMKTLAYHEGIPGHHFQIAIAQELRGVPFFRRLIPFVAYAEGWALYAEKLAQEYGVYKDDPFSQLGYFDSELFRAVRLVVDTGIHYKRWTREQAIEYMREHSGITQESVVSEVERYFVMPGQACAYKIGEIKILELRDKARRELGERFDLRKFHNVVLRNGSMPLTVLEQVVDEYIQTEKV